jgi:hypothetical protein
VLASSSATFEYVDEPRLRRLHPSTGPVTGGTVVLLQTSNLANGCHGARPRCVFNRTEVPATVESPVQVICAAPKHVAGFVHVGVTFTYGSATSELNSQAMFRFVDTPSPRLAPSYGPTLGHSSICMRGSLASSTPWCVFGEAVAQAATCTHCPMSMCCSVPPRARPVAVRVQLALHGAMMPAETFHYVDARVHAVEPVIGPSEGGTLVTVHGKNFDQVGRTFCAFGTNLRVARVVSSTRLTCHSPVGLEERRLQIMTSGHSLANVLTFAYLRPSTAQSGPSPSSGPVAGGTIVTASLGRLPVEPAGSLRCILGRTPTVASHVEGFKVACSSPSHEPGTVAFETALVGHGMDGRLARATFEYRHFRAPVLRPSAGPIRGGTLVVVSGGQWGSSALLGCSFGGAYTPAQVLAPSRLACFSPPAVRQGLTILTVWFEGAVLHRLQFWHHEQPSVVRMHPLAGPNLGGTSVTLAGNNFQRRTAASAISRLWPRGRWGRQGLYAPSPPARLAGRGWS